jgi:hypothetical protein
MKYTRLTKEQLEELHVEFINFLAAQTITAQEWEDLKKNKPEVAEQEVDVFSDLIWEGVLSKASFLENISKHQLFLFKLSESSMHLIVVKVAKTSIDLTTVNGYQWLQQHFASDEVEFLQASKEYSKDRNADVFELVQQGSVITKGELYQFFERIIKN